MTNTQQGLQAQEQTETNNSIEAEFTLIWTAADHIGRDVGSLDFDARSTVRPFLIEAVELALATVMNPENDTGGRRRRALLALDVAKSTFPLATEPLLGRHDAERTRIQMARHGGAFLRDKLDAPPGGTTRSEAQHRSLESGPEGAVYEPYVTTSVASLREPDPDAFWLVDGLWQRGGTGIIGAPPKGGKTWLALDIALSVASGTPALDRFAVRHPGPVLYVAAEGSEDSIKQRLLGLCTHRNLHLDALPHPFEIIPRAIRVDTPDGLGRLHATLRQLKPTLLILDPLVRLHRVDENSASSVSGLLSSLTEVQQMHHLSLIVLHHSTKKGATSKEMHGQDFRGSGDFFAWGDSYLFLSKNGEYVMLSAEHRAAAATAKHTLLMPTNEHPRLRVVEDDHLDSSSEQIAGDQKLDGDVLALLSQGPIGLGDLRSRLKASNQRISEALERLHLVNLITKKGRRWMLLVTNGSSPRPVEV